MRKLTYVLLAAALGLGAAATANAAPVLVAGWDFSQYYSDSVHSIDLGASAAPADIRANYSSLDPNGAGAQAAAFGVYHLPFTPLGDASEPLLPTAGNLAPNQAQGPYNNYSVLTNEGQVNTNDLAMLAVSATSIVFESDLRGVPQIGNDYQLSLAGRSTSGTGSIGIEFSTDGTAFVSIGSFALTGSAALLQSAIQTLGAAADRAFFRLTLSPDAVIDNVGISANLTTVPEPTTALLLATGLLGLVRCGRRRA
jgi:PEP-CTERM motif